MGIFITPVPIFLAVYFSTQGILYHMPGKYKYFLSSTEPVIQKLFTLLLIVLFNCSINEFFFKPRVQLHFFQVSHMSTLFQLNEFYQCPQTI